MLAAYVITRTGQSVAPGDNQLEPADLQDYLSGKIPAYMVPDHIVFLEEFPLNVNGKVDRGRLEAMWRPVKPQSLTPAGNLIERGLIGLWAGILNIPEQAIGIFSDFFELGGHSLKVTALCAAIHKNFQVKIPLEKVFNGPTIRELAEYIEASEKEEWIDLPPAEKREYYPLSSAQKRLFVMQQMEKDYMSYNETSILPLEGEVDKKKIAGVLHRLVQRHESLRTSFHIIHDQAVQIIHPGIPVGIEEYKAAGEEEMSRVWARFVRPFDLSKIPLFRLALVRTGESSGFLLFDIHHIIFDGSSLALIMNEFRALYNDRPLKELTLQYKDYAQWQSRLNRSDDIKKQEDYWLSVIRKDIPPLDIPLDYPRKSGHSMVGRTCYCTIRGPLFHQVCDFIEKNGVTLYMFLLSLYFILLFKYSGKEDIVVGCGVAGRRHPGLKGLIGMFINLLPIRQTIESGQSYLDFLGRVKQVALGAYENQDYQFDELVDRLGLKREYGRNPLFNTQFTFQDLRGSISRETGEEEVDEVKGHPPGAMTRNMQFELSLNGKADEGGILLAFQYMEALYKESTVERMVDHYLEILNQVVVNGESRLEGLELSLDVKKGNSPVSREEVLDFDF